MLSKLGRKRDARKQMIANMATSLIFHGKITTTIPRAKTVTPYVERIFTIAKKDTLTARRTVTGLLNDKKAAAKIFDIGLPNITDLSSGFTTIIKSSTRKGDGAQKAIVMLNSKIFDLKVKAEIAPKSEVKETTK